MTQTLTAKQLSLIRGHDGLVIYIPPVPEMDGVYNVLPEAGLDKVEYGAN